MKVLSGQHILCFVKAAMACTVKLSARVSREIGNQVTLLEAEIPISAAQIYTWRQNDDYSLLVTENGNLEAVTAWILSGDVDRNAVYGEITIKEGVNGKSFTVAKGFFSRYNDLFWAQGAASHETKQFPFVFKIVATVASATLATDTAKTDTPTTIFPLNSLQVLPSIIKAGIINRVHYMLDFANAVTYQLFLWEGADANNVTSESKLLFQSVAGKADAIEYDETGIVQPFTLDRDNYLYFGTDWTAASGDCIGYISVSGIAYY